MEQKMFVDNKAAHAALSELADTFADSEGNTSQEQNQEGDTESSRKFMPATRAYAKVLVKSIAYGLAQGLGYKPDPI